MALQASAAFGQATESLPTAGPAASGTLGEVVVVGQRASLATGQAIKEGEMDIVDSVVAEDINKLPDWNIAEALQRVTGVQIQRDRGEGYDVTIRGLTQVESLLDGREIFTAGAGRILNFEDIPAELVSTVRVYKSASADQLEGGVGGVIDVRTRRPFDFVNEEAALTVRAIHGDLVDRTGGQVSGLLSDRWHFDTVGEFGALLSLSHQRRDWRQDEESTGQPTPRTDLVTGQTVLAPSGTTQSTSVGYRDRDAAHFVLQWDPAPGVDLYAEGSYAQFKTIQDSYEINVFTSGATGQDVTLFPGTHDVQSIVWNNVPLSTLSAVRNTVDQLEQAAVGGSWQTGKLKLTADFSRTVSYDNLFYSGPVLAGTAVGFSQNLSTTVPLTTISGSNLLSPSSLTYTDIAYRVLPFHGALDTTRVDAVLTLNNGFFESLSAGFRHADRGANDGPGLIYGDQSVSIPAASLPGTLVHQPYSDFLPGSTSLTSYLVGSLAGATNVPAYRNSFGITAPVPATGSPLGLWSIDETTDAAYLMTTFKTPGLPFDGNAGLRVVRTRELVDGWQTVEGSGDITPVAVDSRYTDVLPSANLRWQPADGLVLRVTASKTITRPDFSNLSPSLTLLQSPADPTGNSNAGTAGNPLLRPIRSDNVDLAVEKYFDADTSVYATVFWKKADGFLATIIDTEIYNGVPYHVSRLQNSEPADIRGAEFGYQQFYDFLPDWLRGLGMQANYTLVNSDTPNSTLGARVPLEGLSRNSANLVGMYERGPWSTRLAYNWRDRFLTGVTTLGTVGTPIYNAPIGWLDATVAYRVGNVSLAIEGLNLLRTRVTSYIGVPSLPQNVVLDDRQFAATVSVRFP